MELKIYSPQDAGFVQKINWNFEELKKEVTETAAEYASSVYTDDTIKAAKADRAKLNKFVDAINGKRTEIRKKLLAPDEQFGLEVKELAGIVQKAIENIDIQVKGYEQRQREDKTAKVKEFYEANIYDLADVLPFERIFKPEYANSSTTMKSIKVEILATIQKVAEGLAVITELDSKYAFEAKEAFLKTYDLAAAMKEKNRLEEADLKRAAYEEERERIRAEREARAKQQAERVIGTGARTSAPVKTTEVSAGSEIETVEDPVHILDFRVHATKVQLDKLKAFLKENKIPFEPVPKEGQ